MDSLLKLLTPIAGKVSQNYAVRDILRLYKMTPKKGRALSPAEAEEHSCEERLFSGSDRQIRGLAVRMRFVECQKSYC
jgi:hypothetical protein